MRCPQCGTRDTRVVDSRDLDEAATIRRRRECPSCTTRFTTYERVEAGAPDRGQARRHAPGVRPRQARRRPRARRSPAGRSPRTPPSRAADAIEAELRSSGLSEIPRSRIGVLAMERLRALDHIAYIRFASVYQSFEDLEDLKREVDTLFAEGVAPKQGPTRADERPRRPRHPRGAARRAGSGSTPTIRRTSSRRRSTSTSTPASGSSATTATRSSTRVRRSPT